MIRFYRKASKIIILSLILLACFFIKTVFADTIYLNNGASMEGIVLSEDEGCVTVKLRIGTISIQAKDVRKIVKNFDEDNAELEENWDQIANERAKEAEQAKEEKEAIESVQEEEVVEVEAEVESVDIPAPEDTDIHKEEPAETQEEVSQKPKPKIAIKDRRLYVNGSLYYIKGVAYGINYPKCEGGMRGYNNIDFSVFEKDFEMMEKAGINTIRTYEPLPIELLDLALEHNIMLIENIVYPTGSNNFKSKDELTRLQEEAMANAKRHKDHPAILMWSLWNDAPFTWGPGGNTVKKYGFKKSNAFLGEIAKAVKSVDRSHPVTGSNMLGHEGSDLGFDFLDVIGVNAYIGGHGRWLGKSKAKSMIRDLVKMSKKYDKPVVILETGYSTYIKNELRKESQEEIIRSQIEVTGQNIAGITIFQWSDGWWKAGKPNTQDEHIEEHWGIVTGYRKPKSGLKAVSELFNHTPTESKGYKR